LGQDLFSQGVYESIADGEWNDVSTWNRVSGTQTGPDYPELDDDATIKDGHDVISTGTNNDISVNDLTIESTGTLTINDLQIDLFIDGDINLYGSINSTSGNPNKVYLQTNNKTLDGDGLVDMKGGDQLIIEVDCNFVVGSDLTFDLTQINLGGNTTMTNNGTVNLNQNIAKTGGGASAVWVQNANSILNVGGSFNVNIDVSANAVPNDVNYNGAVAQNIASPTDSYYNLSLSGGGIKTQLTYTPARPMKIDKNLSIDGTSTFDPNGEEVILGGSTAQTITGDFAFFDLTINNSFGTNPQISSGGSHTISNSATFTDGVISNSGTITFNDATATSTANSYVDGPVVYIDGATNSGFTYPLGDGDIWARMGVGTLTDGSQFTAQYFDASPIVAFGSAIDGTDFDPATAIISGREYWILSYDGGGTSSAVVTLYWEDGTRSEITDLADLTITKWDGTNWGTDGGIVTTTAGAPAAGSLTTTTAYTTFSPFTFASPNGTNALPVDLTYFEATAGPDGVQLTWETYLERNNDYFQIEGSIDAENFETISIIQGHGTNSTTQRYSYLHTFPSAGVNYFRLRQVDYDGTNEISETISVFVDPQKIPFSCTVFPNPTVNGRFTLRSSLKSDKEIIQIHLLNLNGQVMHKDKVFPNSFNFEREYNLPVRQGLYLLKIRQGYYEDVVKLLLK
jgi:hypothetical protein